MKDELWMQLCEQAAKEEDPEKLMKLVDDINRLLEEKSKRSSPGTTKDSMDTQTPAKEYVCSCGAECRIYYEPNLSVAASHFVQHPFCNEALPPVPVIGKFLQLDVKGSNGEWVTVERASD